MQQNSQMMQANGANFKKGMDAKQITKQEYDNLMSMSKNRSQTMAAAHKDGKFTLEECQKIGTQMRMEGAYIYRASTDPKILECQDRNGTQFYNNKVAYEAAMKAKKVTKQENDELNKLVAQRAALMKSNVADGKTTLAECQQIGAAFGREAALIAKISK